MLGRLPDALLARVLPLLRCPACRGPLAEAAAGLACACACGRAVPFRGSCLDFVDPALSVTRGERFFTGSFRAQRYASTREGHLMRLTTGRTFAEEVATVTAGLALTGAERVLDLAIPREGRARRAAREHGVHGPVGAKERRAVRPADSSPSART